MFAMAPDLSVNTEAPLAALRACRGSRVTLVARRPCGCCTNFQWSRSS